MAKLLFGTAGIPASAKKQDTVNGIKRVRELGLDAMELEFVYGVKMGMETAGLVKQAAGEAKVSLSVHAPYYINLNAQDRKKTAMSRQNILRSCRAGHAAGAHIVLFHPGFYMGKSPEETMAKVSENLEGVLEAMEKESLGINLGLETTGKKSAFGNLGEVLALSEKYRGVLPVIDFSHLHARGNGSLTDESAFSGILGKVPAKFLKGLHIHASGMNFTDKGERNHLDFEDKGNSFNYRAMLTALKKHGVSGTVICESPDIEGDALLMKKFFTARA
jgi:deoxyribonuclease-4